MPAILKWKQVNEQLPVADINTVPVPLDKVVWHEFSIPDTMTRAQLVCLFTRPIPMVLRDGSIVVSNDSATRQLYHKVAAKEHLTVVALDKITSDDKLVKDGVWP